MIIFSDHRFYSKCSQRFTRISLSMSVSYRRIDSFIYLDCFVNCVRFGGVFFTTFCSTGRYQIPIQYTKLFQGAQREFLPSIDKSSWCIPVVFAKRYNLGFHSSRKVMIYHGDYSRIIPNWNDYLCDVIILFSFFTFSPANLKTAENLQKNGCPFLVLVRSWNQRKVHVFIA